MPSPQPSADVRRARRAVSAVFAVHGAVAGSFVTRIPWIKEHLDVSTGQLGLALACPALGASVAMPLASRIMHQYGARAAVRALLTLWCAALALPAAAPGILGLAGLLFVFGATAGMADVVMNAQGVEVERRYAKSIMSGLHGLWSTGALLGSAAGVAAVHWQLDARVHLALTAALLALLSQPSVRGLLDVRPEPDQEAPPRFALPPRSALLIGAVGMCAILAEGASMDWSGIYLRDVTGGSETLAAASYTAFACTMAAARLAGDTVVRRIGPVHTVRASGLLALAGGILVVIAPVPATGIAGFALLGVGIAVVVPLAFTAAGHSGPEPSQAIAGVATITYTTGLAAPTLVGVVGELSSLRVSFAIVAAAMAAMVAAAGVLGTRRTTAVASGSGSGEAVHARTPPVPPQSSRPGEGGTR
ncbi:MFS transporter [Streptomyces sp. YIM 98790]|uniref:MFS transporter n=1 Tax=Streptomyces sp. YIM 98790 TaxID=2689077 RepID=UPI00140BE0DA|nr:MFS transporter [Streptomyces sp. YIM 98790]